MSSLSDSGDIQGYRLCEEDFEPGFVDQATEDHLPKLAPDKQKAEIAIRDADKRGPSRAIATFVFERLEIAKRLLNQTKGFMPAAISVPLIPVVAVYMQGLPASPRAASYFRSIPNK